MKHIVLQTLFFLFPWKVRRYLLIGFFKFEIHPTARIGFSWILAKKLILKEHAIIGNLNLCKRIDLLQLSIYAKLGSLNYITGFADGDVKAFSHVVNRTCQMIVGEQSRITSRHFFDCNGGLFIGRFTTIAGLRSVFLSHSIDVYENRQDAAPIMIGDYCFVGTGCTLLKGAQLPSYCVLGAGSLLNKFYEELYCLYAGSPARLIKRLDQKKVKYFERTEGFVL